MNEDYDSLTEATEVDWDSDFEPEDEAEDAGEELADGEVEALETYDPDDEDELPEDVTDYEAGELPSD